MEIPRDLAARAGTAATSSPSLSEADAAVYAAWFKALADPTRIRILNLLARSNEPVCFYDIANHFALGQSTISHHLKVLRDTHLLDTERRGTYMHYQVNREAVAALPGVLRRLLQGSDGAELGASPSGTSITN